MNEMQRAGQAVREAIGGEATASKAANTEAAPLLTHVFSGIPNTKRHRAALDALRPYLNTKAYRMRVRGRGKKPGHKGTGWGGDVRLDDAARFSIYLDSDHERQVWQRVFAAQNERDAARRVHLEDVKRLNSEVCDLIDQRKALEASRERLTRACQERANMIDTRDVTIRALEGMVADRNRERDELLLELAWIPGWVRAFFKFWKAVAQ